MHQLLKTKDNISIIIHKAKEKKKNLFIRGSLEYDPAVHILWNLFTESSEFNLHLKPTGDRPKAKLQTEV